MRSAIVIYVMVMLSTCSLAQREGPAYHLLHRETGYLPYAYHADANQYVGINKANVIGSHRTKHATWYTITHDDGTISFKNKETSLCLQHKARDVQVLQNPCNYYNSDMKFIITDDLNETLIKSAGAKNLCLFTAFDNTFKSKTCQRLNPDFHWSFVSPGRIQF